MHDPHSDEPISAEIVFEEPISAELAPDNPFALKRRKKFRFRFGLLVPIVIFCGAIGALIFFCISTYYRIEAGTHGISKQIAGIWVLDETSQDTRRSGDTEHVEDTDTGNAEDEERQPSRIAKKSTTRSSVNEFMKDPADVYLGMQNAPQISIGEEGSGTIEFDWKFVRDDAEGSWSIMRVHDETIVLSFQLSFEQTQLKYEETLAGPVLFSIEMDGDDFFVVKEIVVPGQPAVAVDPMLRFKRIGH